MVVGNKVDKEDMRQISRKEAEAFAKEMGALFIETSARMRVGVKDAFVEVVRKIIETPEVYQKSAAPRAANMIWLDRHENYNKGNTCC
ncbi:hypothetical protein BJ741DRAFT_242752 [Chytriomyces cf. hyalinus JEL632]|nr:hypothetical protein BJ741DRAFT_242752 [Chytriomyces cf. hyalinus JEL632]